MKTEKMNKQKKLWFLAGGVGCIVLLLVIWAVVGADRKVEDSEELKSVMTIDLFPGFSGEDVSNVIEGTLTNPEVLLEYAGSYDGVFYEDGKGQEKDQVFSLILTNTAEDTLEVMQLWIEDEEGETYQFQVSALPTGGTVLAQELSGKKFRKDAKYKIVRDNFGFLEENKDLSVLSTEEREGNLYVTNNSQTDVGSVQIIYKNWLGGYAYPGGIAYRISLEGVKAGETLKITSENYKPEKSRVTAMKKTEKPEEENNEESTD